MDLAEGAPLGGTGAAVGDWEDETARVADAWRGPTTALAAGEGRTGSSEIADRCNIAPLRNRRAFLEREGLAPGKAAVPHGMAHHGDGPIGPNQTGSEQEGPVVKGSCLENKEACMADEGAWTRPEQHQGAVEWAALKVDR